MASERKRLEKRLDVLCRDIVQIEAKSRCAIQQTLCWIHVPNGDPHHIVVKGCGSSKRRFDLKNLIWVCRPCHDWWGNNIKEAETWFARKFPKRSKYLDQYRGGVAAPISDAKMKDLIVEYKEKLKDLS